MKKLVIALGGNALGENVKEQKIAVKKTAESIVNLLEAGNKIILTHGNGPQVGMINLAMSDVPLDTCVAMSQGYIGFDLQNAIRAELKKRNLSIPISTIVTQVTVDKDAPEFQNPTKPIGKFYGKKIADKMKADGMSMKAYGNSFRRVVPSPKPIDIVEKETIKTLMDAGQLVITVGGGGIPVVENGNELIGVEAVIDKDFASALLAKQIDADMLIILTAVKKVAINFGKPNEILLDEINSEDAKKYISEGQFGVGSMLPKVEAAMEFANSKIGRTSLITLLECAEEAIAGKTGTIFIK